MSDDSTTAPGDIVEQLTEAALLCGADGEMFAQRHLHFAAGAIAALRAEADDYRAQRDAQFLRATHAEDLIRSVQAELLAGGSLARLRAIVGITQE